MPALAQAIAALTPGAKSHAARVNELIRLHEQHRVPLPVGEADISTFLYSQCRFDPSVSGSICDKMKLEATRQPDAAVWNMARWPSCQPGSRDLHSGYVNCKQQAGEPGAQQRFDAVWLSLAP
jgi:putative component of membrane protein insertase Oxa1/YidC/SpoIIIJ protein YidD